MGFFWWLWGKNVFHRVYVSNFVMHGCSLASLSNYNFWKSQLSITCLIIIKPMSKPLISAVISCSGNCSWRKHTNGLRRSPSPVGESVAIPFLEKHNRVAVCYGEKSGGGSTCKVIITHYPGFKKASPSWTSICNTNPLYNSAPPLPPALQKSLQLRGKISFSLVYLELMLFRTIFNKVNRPSGQRWHFCLSSVWSFGSSVGFSIVRSEVISVKIYSEAKHYKHFIEEVNQPNWSWCILIALLLAKLEEK